MANYIVSSGEISSGIILQRHDSMTVMNGGTAIAPTVSAGGGMYISSGGTAREIIENGGYVDVGDNANVTFVSHMISGQTLNDSATVHSGTTANGNTIDSNGYLTVFSGGIANSTTVSAGGRAFIFSCGAVDVATIEGARKTVSASYPVYSIYEVDDYGEMTVGNGGNANNISVKPLGKLNVSSGGTASRLFVTGFSSTTFSRYAYPPYNTYAIVTVRNGCLDVCGGTANDAVASSCGLIKVHDGGVLNSAMISSGGIAIISSGGTADNTAVCVGGSFTVSSGGTGTNIIVSDGAWLHLTVASDTYVQGTSGGSAFEVKDALLSGYSMNNESEIIVEGGTANDITIFAGQLHVFSDGIANNALVNGTISSWIHSNQTAGTITGCRGSMHISNGGIANDARVISGGMLYVDGTANNTTVNYNGSMFISSGGTATGIIENGGYVDVKDGADVTFASNTFSGLVLTLASATIHSGTTVNSASISIFSDLFVCGGIANVTTVFGGNLTVYSGGTANNTTVSGGTIRVSSGGMANNTTINANGSMFISSGGTANNTTINANGSMFISSGGTATIAFNPWQGTVGAKEGAIVTYLERDAGVYLGSNDTLVSKTNTLSDQSIEAGISALLYSGGTANNTTVNSGIMHLSLGGIANDITVNNGGSVIVYSGGTASEVKENGGFVEFEDGANLTFTSNTFSGLVLSKIATVHSGTTANRTDINSGGSMHVFSGGFASRTTVFEGGNLSISSGGLVVKTSINTGGQVAILSGGTARNNTINVSGSMTVSSGGTVDSTSVIAGGIMKILSGGMLTGSVSLDRGSLVSAERGSILNFDLTLTAPDNKALLNDWSLIQGTPDCTLMVDGTLAYGTYLLAENAEDFEETITVVNTSDKSLGTLEVGESTMFGGFKYSLNLINGLLSVTLAETKEITSVTKVISSGHISDELIVFNDGILQVISGGTATRTTVNTGGSLVVFEGGLANDTTVNDGYSGMYISSGGTANNTAVFKNAYIHVCDGGIASNTTINTEGGYIVHSGGTANGVILSGDNAGFEVWVGGVANDLIINGGTACLHAVYPESGKEEKVGGRANNTVINSGGKLDVDGEGTIADGIIVHSGGWLNFFDSGAVLTGRITLENGAIITVKNRIRLNFDLTRTSTGTDALVKGLSKIQNVADCTLMVDGTLAYGTYLLAENAEDFEETITVVNSLGQSLGILTNGKTVTIDETDYLLNLDAGNLTVTLSEYVPPDDIPPEIKSITQDITAPTNQSVTLTVEFIDNVKVATKQYRIGDGAWNEYVDGVTANMNATVYFRATDAAGNESEVASYEVSNIDKVAPSAPSGLKALKDEQTVMLIWNASTDNLSGVKEYVVNYSNGSQSFTVKTNNTNYMLNDLSSGSWTWSVQTLDNAGNVSTATNGKAFTVQSAEPEKPYIARGDRDGNGVSDVMFVWTGNTYAHGYWMNGSSDWWSANAPWVSPDWDNLGSYDMSGDGKADVVMFGNVEVNGNKGAYIGYYQDGDDANGWVNIGYLDNAQNITWKNKVGNLTGNASGANSIVWYAPDLYALGVWKDGKEDWATLSGSFGGEAWTLVGCGDFDSDGKDSVLMSYNNGQMFYSVGLDDEAKSHGSANWSNGWEVRAIGDFAGDGKDDIVLFHKESGAMVMLLDGNVDNYQVIGQLDPTDWFIAGCGDYNADGTDDLLVRQFSSGMLGYYSNGNQSNWNVLGYGVGMEWTVIA